MYMLDAYKLQIFLLLFRFGLTGSLFLRVNSKHDQQRESVVAVLMFSYISTLVIDDLCYAILHTSHL
jgi:hypothetical protein